MITFGARMGVSSPAVQDWRNNGDVEKIGVLESAIQSFQSWTGRMEDRITRLEADVFTNKSKIRDNKDVLQLFESKLQVLEVRDQRLDRVLSALEGFLEVNSIDFSSGVGGELNSDLPLGLIMSSPHAAIVSDREQTSLMTWPGVSRTRKNVDKLLASEKCKPMLDFPERIKSVPSPSSSAGLKTTDRGHLDSLMQREGTGDQTLTHEENTSALGHDSVNENQREATQTNEKGVGVLKKYVKENSTVKLNNVQAAQLSSSSTSDNPSNQTLKKIAEASPGISKVKSTIKRKLSKSSSQTEPAPDISNLSSTDSRRAPGPSKLNNKKMEYECQICCKVFATRVAFKNDQRFHKTGKLKCHLCEFETTRESYMSKHLKRWHSGCRRAEIPRVETEVQVLDKTFSCDFQGCDKSYRRRQDLRKHVKHHTAETLTCATSKALTNSDTPNAPSKNTSLLTPDSKIIEIGPTTQKAFSDLQMVKKCQRFHIRGTLKCHLCSIEFATMRLFRGHFKLSHPDCTPPEDPLGDIPLPDLKGSFVCQVPGCAKDFGSKLLLQTHSKCHAGEKLECNLCEFKCFRMGEFERHIQNVHREALQEKILAIRESGDSPREVTEVTPKEPNLTGPAPKKKIKLSKTPKIKLPFCLSKSVDKNKSRDKEVNKGIESELTNPKTPASASRPSLKRSAIVSQKSKSSLSTFESKEILKFSPIKEVKSSETKKHKKRSRKQKEPEQREEASASELEPLIPPTPPPPFINVTSPVAPENDGNFEDENQVHGCPLCSKSFSKISKLDRHFQKKH